jgi:fructose-1-phosphate kinase PfkB-like protein
MSTILTITANPLLDHLATVALEPGRVHRITRFQPVAGGKGLNVARVLARHGHRVLAAGFLGGSPGEQVAQLVMADGIEPCFTPIAAHTRIGFLLNDPAAQHTPTAVMERGPDVQADEVGALVATVRARLAEIDLVIISGAVPCSACDDLYRVLLDTCAMAGVTCWVDAYGPAMDRALAGANPPALAKPNQDEHGEDGLRWVTAREMHLTDGPHEIRVRTPEGRFRVRPPVLQERNPVGSGDCYLAALAHARLSHWSLPDQLRYAAAAGSANAARPGVADIGPQDIQRLSDAVQVTPAP